ncbi:unnamed protein product [Cylicostephanus goldi]|uniref:Possible tRNA binding domain-containing protein n=1 Tax=Cylicostephanus goldi TaxID=71465 RepID=A0A3P7MNG6_CYLGO|nr:unnamed protein product [Cylicostephanus goldi]
MLKRLNEESDSSSSWLAAYFREFRKRLLSLLSFEFKKLPISLGLSLLQIRNKEVLAVLQNDRKVITREQLSMFLSNVDLKRLSEYARNLVDHQMITDLLPTISKLYFGDKLRENHKSAENVQEELDLPQSQVLAFHSKTIRKLSDEFDAICMESLRQLIPDKTRDLDKEEQAAAVARLKPLAESLEVVMFSEVFCYPSS